MKTQKLIIVLMLITVASANGATFTNSTPIEMLFGGSGTSAPNVATPYPSDIVVSGDIGPVRNVSVTLHDLSHTFPWDLHILLVGPTGQTVLLMAEDGGNTPINDAELTFTDNAPALPNPLMEGVYSPTSNTSTAFESFPPAPAGPYGTTLSGFAGLDPVGTWSLYVVDYYESADDGEIAGGWSLSFGPNFTYQGRLLDNNIAADELYDIQFKLYDDPNTAVASQIGPDNTLEDIDVVDGYFIAELSFGETAFNGEPRWLQIEVRPYDSTDPGDYVALNPLQPITPTPYASYAAASDWNNLANLPASFADGVDDGANSWSELSGIPAGFADGIDDAGIGAETDPIFGASAAAGIASPAIANWNTAFGWGDHSTAGYLTGYSETDPKVGTITPNYVPRWDGSTLVTGTITDNGSKVAIGEHPGVPEPQSKVQIYTDLDAYGVRIANVQSSYDYAYGVYSYVAAGGTKSRALSGTSISPSGENYGVYGYAALGDSNYGVFGKSSSTSNSYAGYFDGDVKVTGDLTWNAKTSYISIPPGAFVPKNETADYFIHAHYLEVGYNSMYAPVQLPHGSTLNKLVLYYTDSHTLKDVGMDLIRIRLSDSLRYTMVDWVSVGTPGTTTKTFTSSGGTLSYPDIDNSIYTYVLVTYCGEKSTFLRYRGAVLEYQYTEPH